MIIDGNLRTRINDFLFFAETPVVYHCHHFNLFLDQSIDDALGAEDGQKLRFQAARESSYQLISNVVNAVGAELPAEKMEIASELFKFLGQGSLQILGDDSGGEARGEYLHYGFSWKEKYGKRIKRNKPADTFAAGYASAALEVAFQCPRESFVTIEQSCIVKRDPICSFSINPSQQGNLSKFIDQKMSVDIFNGSIEGKNETTISEIANGLSDFTKAISGDQRGLIEAFGVFVAMHLPGYYNRISYDGEEILRKRNPKMVSIFNQLLVESGHVCVFNTFAGILLSPEWEALVGPVSGDVEELITHCTAIGRALGFGHWVIEDLVPDQRLVLRIPNSYESVYLLNRHGVGNKRNSYFLQGSGLAMMVLAHKYDWKNKPELNQKTYSNLFRGGLGWKVEETKSLSVGDLYTEIVVTKTA